MLEPSSDPLNIVLVIAGSRGYRLLFRYPFKDTTSNLQNDDGAVVTTSRNPFGVDRNFRKEESHSSSILDNGKLFGYPDDILANILAPTSNLCEVNFELKIDEAVFIGHPVLVERSDDVFSVKKETKAELKDDVSLKIFNIVLVVNSGCNHSIINSYQMLCKMLANAIRHEEKR